MKILIIDGQSGRIGSQLIDSLRKTPPSREHAIVAVGANALATSAMLKAGADQGATGENAVIVQCRSASIIAGPMGIAIADSLLGEITPAMAAAVGQSSASRVLLPSHQCGSLVAGMPSLTRQQLIDAAADLIRQLCV